MCQGRRLPLYAIFSLPLKHILSLIRKLSPKLTQAARPVHQEGPLQSPGINHHGTFTLLSA